MIQIDLGQDQVFEVTVNGKTYELREPTVSEIDQFRNVDAEKAGVQTVTKFLTTIGMPEDVVQGLAMSKAKRLIDALMDELTKKK